MIVKYFCLSVITGENLLTQKKGIFRTKSTDKGAVTMSLPAGGTAKQKTTVSLICLWSLCYSCLIAFLTTVSHTNLHRRAD